LKPEQTINVLRRYIKRSLGEFFVTPLIFQLRDAYDVSEASKPLLLMLTPGNDPMDAIRKVAKECSRIFHAISLGKGQDKKAKKLIEDTRHKTNGGGWVVLQNCHLYSSFLPELEQIIENM
jgi:dynein heavy chain